MSKRLFLALVAVAGTLTAAPSSGTAEPSRVRQDRHVAGDVPRRSPGDGHGDGQAAARPDRAADRPDRRRGSSGRLRAPSPRKMSAKRLQLGVFHGFEFARVRADHPDLVPLLITVPPARKLQAVVVVRDDAKAKTLADLDGEPCWCPGGTKAHCLLYLDSARAGLPAGTAKPHGQVAPDGRGGDRRGRAWATRPQSCSTPPRCSGTRTCNRGRTSRSASSVRKPDLPADRSRHHQGGAERGDRRQGPRPARRREPAAPPASRC